MAEVEFQLRPDEVLAQASADHPASQVIMKSIHQSEAGKFKTWFLFDGNTNKCILSETYQQQTIKIGHIPRTPTAMVHRSIPIYLLVSVNIPSNIFPKAKPIKEMDAID